MKILLIITALLSFFSSFIPVQPRIPELIDQENYFSADNLPLKHEMLNLLLLSSYHDADKIEEMFSLTARQEITYLEKHIEELIDFCNHNIDSWSYESTSTTTHTLKDQIQIQIQVYTYLFYKDDISYRCHIKKTIIDNENYMNRGISGIVIYPTSFYKDCLNYYPFEPGICIFYPGEKEYKENTMRTIHSYAEQGNLQGIYDLFSQVTKEKNPSLRKDISNLMNFMTEDLLAWRFQDYLIEKDVLDGKDIIKRQLLFDFAMQDGELYRCEIRDMIEDAKNGANLGIYSINIYKEDLYTRCSGLGWKNPGIFINHVAPA